MHWKRWLLTGGIFVLAFVTVKAIKFGIVAAVMSVAR